MKGKRRKTVLRTIRLSEEIDELLERDAQEQNISTNALIAKIMTRYMEWERVVEKLEVVSFSNTFLTAILNEVSDEKLKEIASQVVIREIKNQTMWEFGKADFDTLLKTVTLRVRYGWGCHISVENREDGSNVITLHHKWGHKGKVFFRSFFDSFIRGELRTQPTIDITDNIMTVSYAKPMQRTP